MIKAIRLVQQKEKSREAETDEEEVKAEETFFEHH